MLQTEFIIVGQGISGTFLSWQLHRAGKSFIVFDDGFPASSSRVAAGIINPVTGRRIVETWMIDTLLPFVLSQYRELGAALDLELIRQKDVIDFFPSPQMMSAFEKRVNENCVYLSFPPDAGKFRPYFNDAFGYGVISPSYAVDLASLLPAWRRKLREDKNLIEEKFVAAELKILGNGVQYGNIYAEKIIFCDGISSAEQPWFNKLPFALNKGEALIIRCNDIPKENIYKKGMTMVPLQEDYFWIGSSYEWNFAHPHPTASFRSKTTVLLDQWLKIPYIVEDHLSSVRPATIERRPFVGLHPLYPQIGILNGMGTKGCSLAPWFSKELAALMTDGSLIMPEADISRFRRILSS